MLIRSETVSGPRWLLALDVALVLVNLSTLTVVQFLTARDVLEQVQGLNESIQIKKLESQSDRLLKLQQSTRTIKDEGDDNQARSDQPFCGYSWFVSLMVG